jgi:hypothetical protein
MDIISLIFYLGGITNHNPLVVYRHLTTGGMWYNVLTTEYTTNHNPLVVYRHLTTGELWYMYIQQVSIYNKWIVICGILCCIYIISQFTCCMVSIYNKWIVICSILCMCKVSIIFLIYCDFISIQVSFFIDHNDNKSQSTGCI